MRTPSVLPLTLFTMGLACAGCATTPKTSAVATSRPGLMASGPEWLTAEGPAPSLRGHHVVFVAGFMSEVIPGYFIDNAAVTRELGAETSTLFPPSSSSLVNDVGLVEREVAAHRNVPVVLVGHSKGGAAVLLTVLQHPELVLTGRVECVVVIQGAVGGSPLADALTKVRPLAKPGLRSLTTGQAKSAFVLAMDAAARSLTEAEWARLFSRIFYVRSAHREGSLGAELAITELILREHGENDGLLPPGEMKLDEGVDLGVLDADHASLTVSSFLSVTTVEERRAFTTALYREVGRRLGWAHLPQ